MHGKVGIKLVVTQRETTHKTQRPHNLQYCEPMVVASSQNCAAKFFCKKTFYSAASLALLFFVFLQVHLEKQTHPKPTSRAGLGCAAARSLLKPLLVLFQSKPRFPAASRRCICNFVIPTQWRRHAETYVPILAAPTTRAPWQAGSKIAIPTT